MNDDYDKVIEFFSEHETAIYGLGPTDDGAEEGSLLWCIKELDSMFDINIYIDNRDRIIKQKTLKVICTLIDIYEKKDAEERELNSEVRLIDANALIKDIAESIRLADEWEKEAREKEDKHGIKCAIDTRRSLLAMISRVKEAPIVEANLCSAGGGYTMKRSVG